MKNMFIAIVLSAIGFTSAYACQSTTTQGPDMFFAQGLCRSMLHGQPGSCYPGSASGTFWICDCTYNCNNEDPSNPADIDADFVALLDQMMYK